jgi:ribonuclease E
VLNHKRGHLRDLENGFKVNLAVIADPTVTGQQSFIIDRGEQVHTLEAAKALLAAQVAAFPPPLEEAYDDEEAFDVEVEVETEETEGLTDDQAASEGGEGEADGDGRKRKRRRRRRGRSGEGREGGAPHPRDGNEVPLAAVAVEGAETPADDGEGDEDEDEDQTSEVRADQPAGNGERRPRRRGRRGGRRRRGGPDEGLAGSIADELGPPSVPESTEAVADLDGYTPEPYHPVSEPEPRPEPVAPQGELQHADHGAQEAPRADVRRFAKR